MVRDWLSHKQPIRTTVLLATPDTRRHTMHASTAPGPLTVAPDGGEALRFLGDSTMRIKLDGGTAFYEYAAEPGVTGPPQHVHHGHDETFYVVEGSFEFVLGEETVMLEKGSFLSVPRGTPHTFRNAGGGPGRIVGTFSPGRFANYFRELAAIIERTGAAPDREAWTELYGRYDTTFYGGAG
jgi:mannose-6-phosphate isomerase-like protein (cupin superfamily)